MASSEADGRAAVLLASVFTIAVAGLIYELIAGTLSTYLLGSSVTVFSVVIGVFLSAMGLGAFAAQFVRRDLVRAFVVAELALALVGGLSALVLFAAFAWLGDGYRVALGGVCIAVGALVGVEIPLLLRILEERVDLRVAVSHVLALDYAGALLASIAFPLLMLPYLGLVRSSALFGLLNLVVAGLALAVFHDRVRRRGALVAAAAAIGAVLVTTLVGGGRATSWMEDQLYADAVLYAESTAYQRIVVTRWRDDVRLYVDGHLQFSTADEYRYHEALVHPAMTAARSPTRVLVLGGGDGLAAREILKHPAVRTVDIVDLDPVVTALFRDRDALAALNEGSLGDPRVALHHTDALRFLEESDARWDVIIADLPDPNDPALSRLYSVGAFELAVRRLADGGALATQATSPFGAPDAYWCIVRTLETAVERAPVARRVHPYHVHVPSFGEWGFALVIAGDAEPASTVDVPTRFLDEDAIAAMFRFPRDLERRDVEVNRLGNAVLARYYRAGWRRYHGP